MAARRLNLFAKGNVDVRDSLHCCSVAGKIRWNGINEIVRARFPGSVVRVRHEVWTRSDALLETKGTIPPGLRERNLPLAPFTLDAQFSRRALDGDDDAVVLSIQPDVANPLFRRRHDGCLLLPYGVNEWREEDRHWLQEEFEVVNHLTVATSMANLAQIIRDIRSRREAHILLYNMCSVIPGEQVHCHQGLEEILSTRIKRFNLAALELSQQLGISIVDVDGIAARAGTDRVTLDAGHLTAEGHQLVAQEVVRILEDLGCFDDAS